MLGMPFFFGWQRHIIPVDFPEIGIIFGNAFERISVKWSVNEFIEQKVILVVFRAIIQIDNLGEMGTLFQGIPGNFFSKKGVRFFDEPVCLSGYFDCQQDKDILQREGMDNIGDGRLGVSVSDLFSPKRVHFFI